MPKVSTSNSLPRSICARMPATSSALFSGLSTPVIASVSAHPDVIGVFSDPVIESTIVCPGDAAIGSDADVANRLGVTQLQAAGLDGHGVYLAVVDTGINLVHLKAKGRKTKLSSIKSFTPQGVNSKPGKHPVNHGTMCAL